MNFSSRFFFFFINFFGWTNQFYILILIVRLKEKWIYFQKHLIGGEKNIYVWMGVCVNKNYIFRYYVWKQEYIKCASF